MLNIKSVYFLFLAFKINFSKFFKKIYFKSDIYNKSLISKSPQKIFFYPSPILLSSFTNSNNFSYKITGVNPLDFWNKKNTKKEKINLHSFLWLNLLDRKNEETEIRKIIISWIDNNKKYKPLIWDGEVASKRIISWILNAEIILNSSNHVFKNDFFSSIITQTNHLRKNFKFEKDHAKKIEILTSIFLTGLVFKEYEENTNFSLREIKKIIEVFFDENGFPLSKNPSDLLNFSKYFVLIRECAKEAQQYIPDYLDEIIMKNLQCLKNITTPENKLPLFNGSVETNLEDYYSYLDNLNIKIKSKKETVGDIKIIKNKREIIYFDIGNPPPKNYSSSYQSGALTFEYFLDGEKVITNCGFGLNISKKAILISKLTSAQSTLCINDTSIIKVERSKIMNKAFGYSSKGKFKILDPNTKEESDEIKVSASHDAYLKIYGCLHKREISIDKKDFILKGSDQIIIKKEEKIKKYSIRFHLYPGINAIKTRGGNSVLIQINKKKSLIFSTSDQNLNVEKSIFLGGNKIINNFCITISGKVENIDRIINWEIRKSI